MEWTGFDRERAYARAAEDPRIERRQQARWAAQDWVRDLVTEKATWLLKGSAAPSDANAVVKQLLKHIEDEDDAETRRLRRNSLIRSIEQGCREKRWEIQLPTQTLKSPLPKPTLTEENFGNLGRTDRLRGAFLDALLEPDYPQMACLLAIRKYGHAKVPLTAKDLKVGRALLAAILFGGVVTKARLEAIAQAGPNSLVVLDEKLWMEWPQLSTSEAAVDRWHRWYPEQVSGALFAIAHRDNTFPLVKPLGNVTCAEAIWKRVEAALVLLPLEAEDRPSSLTQLMTWVTTWLDFRIPPVLGAYASERVDSASLPPEHHLRMLTGKPVAIRSIEIEEIDVAPPRSPAPQGTVISAEAAAIGVLRRELRATLTKRKEKHKAVQALTAFLARKDLSPVFVRLAEWLRELCDHHKDGGARRRLSTIRTYLTRIDYPLAVVLEARDPAALDAEELGGLYSEVLDGIGRKSPQRAANAVYPLMLFHRYLVSAHGVLEDVGGVFEGRSVDGTVDANLVTEQEYLRAMADLDAANTGQFEWLAKMQKAALLLGYRGKLRRGEVRRLRIGDVCGAVFGVLYVRTTEHGRVKSSAGIRNIPLAGHFLKEEMVALREFVVSRLREITGSDDFTRILSPYDEESRAIRARPLFEHRERPGELVPESALFDPLVGSLKQVTLDPSSHFHLLRKGGQNWAFPGLMEEELPGCSHHFDSTGSIAKASEALNKGLLKTTGPDRRKLWALSESVGHASPSTTTGSYIHCLDWLLSFALQKISPLLSTKNLAVLTGLTENNIRVQRSKKKIADSHYLYWIGHNHPDWLQRVAPSLTPPAVAPSTQQVPKAHVPRPPLSGTDTIALLDDCAREGKDSATIARRNSLLPEVVLPWLKHAKALDGMVGISPAKQGKQISSEENQGPVAGYGISIDRRLPFFPKVCHLGERRRLNKWTAALHGFAFGNPVAAAAWLNTFWNNRRAKGHAVGFRTISGMSAFLTALLQFAPEEADSLDYRLYPLLTKKAPPPQEQGNTWANGIGIPASRVSLDKGLARQYDGDGIGTLTFSLKHEHQLSRETVRKKKRGYIPKLDWDKTESVALEGACYVVTIWMLSGLYEGVSKTTPVVGSETIAKPAESSIEGPAKVTRRKRAPAEDHRPELVVLCGIPAAGKTTRYQAEYAKTHVHLSLDRIESGSRKREWDLFCEAIARGDSIVVDNTNLTPKHRARYIPAARAAGYRIVGVELKVTIEEALKRNASRKNRIPEVALRARAKEFIDLKIEEGFDVLLRNHRNQES